MEPYSDTIRLLVSRTETALHLIDTSLKRCRTKENPRKLTKTIELLRATLLPIPDEAKIMMLHRQVVGLESTRLTYQERYLTPPESGEKRPLSTDEFSSMLQYVFTIGEARKLTHELLRHALSLIHPLSQWTQEVDRLSSPGSPNDPHRQTKAQELQAAYWTLFPRMYQCYKKAMAYLEERPENLDNLHEGSLLYDVRNQQFPDISTLLPQRPPKAGTITYDSELLFYSQALYSGITAPQGTSAERFPRILDAFHAMGSSLTAVTSDGSRIKMSAAFCEIATETSTERGIMAWAYRQSDGTCIGRSISLFPDGRLLRAASQLDFPGFGITYDQRDRTPTHRLEPETMKTDVDVVGDGHSTLYCEVQISQQPAHHVRIFNPYYGKNFVTERPLPANAHEARTALTPEIQKIVQETDRILSNVQTLIVTGPDKVQQPEDLVRVVNTARSLKQAAIRIRAEADFMSRHRRSIGLIESYVAHRTFNIERAPPPHSTDSLVFHLQYSQMLGQAMRCEREDLEQTALEDSLSSMWERVAARLILLPPSEVRRTCIEIVHQEYWTLFPRIAELYRQTLYTLGTISPASIKSLDPSLLPLQERAFETVLSPPSIDILLKGETITPPYAYGGRHLPYSERLQQSLASLPKNSVRNFPRQLDAFCFVGLGTSSLEQRSYEITVASGEMETAGVIQRGFFVWACRNDASGQTVCIHREFVPFPDSVLLKAALENRFPPFHLTGFNPTDTSPLSQQIPSAVETDPITLYGTEVEGTPTTSYVQCEDPSGTIYRLFNTNRNRTFSPDPYSEM
jgi:hypothetical protein